MNSDAESITVLANVRQDVCDFYVLSIAQRQPKRSAKSFPKLKHIFVKLVAHWHDMRTRTQVY